MESHYCSWVKHNNHKKQQIGWSSISLFYKFVGKIEEETKLIHYQKIKIKINYEIYREEME